MFPNDEEENDRLDLYHHIETLSLSGELHLAPIGDEPQRILGIKHTSSTKVGLATEELQISELALESGPLIWVCTAPDFQCAKMLTRSSGDKVTLRIQLCCVIYLQKLSTRLLKFSETTSARSSRR